MTNPFTSAGVEKLSEPQMRALKALVQDGNLYLHNTGEGTVLVGPAETKVCDVRTGYALIKRGLATFRGRYSIAATSAGRLVYQRLVAEALRALTKGADHG